jgi:hypothetical protein
MAIIFDFYVGKNVTQVKKRFIELKDENLLLGWT